MKNRYLLVPAIGLVATTPAMAQDSVSGAVKGTMTATPLPSPPPRLYAPPAPPAPPRRVKELDESVPPPPVVMVAPPAPPPPPYPRKPRLMNYRDVMPTPADYPLSSWQNDEEGYVRYTIYVDEKGTATRCTVDRSSGFAALDAKTCEVVMERAEFSPAMEDADTPVAGSITRTYSWRKRETEFPPFSITFQFIQDEQGRSLNCKVLNKEGTLPESMRRDLERSMEEGNACPRGIGGRSAAPYRDENGVPVAKQVTVTLDVKVEDPVE